MSHSKEREEKICLNCGAALTGRYCPVCGQENTEPKETVWGLVSHFFNDITHFDGKFFSTVKYLVLRPGFLSAEYIKGRRASYLHPIRMYVFTSAFFFIIFFSLFNPKNLMSGSKDKEEELKELIQAGSALKEQLVGTGDTVLKTAIQRSIEHIDGHAILLEKQIAVEKQRDSAKLAQRIQLADTMVKKVKGHLDPDEELANKLMNIDSLQKLNKEGPGIVDIRGMGIDKVKFNNRSRIAYDSVQKELPPDRRDGWIKRRVEYKTIQLNAKWKNDRKELVALLMERFMHTLPQALFVSLPVFAFILLLLYARRKFFYVDHGIFAIHLYCATFILLLLYFGIDKLKVLSGWGWLALVKTVMVLGIFFYLYKAMRKFYGQGRFKTILKFTILNIFSFIVVIMLVILFFLLSLAQFS